MECTKCEQEVTTLVYHYLQGSICLDCLTVAQQYLVDSVVVADGEVRVMPLTFSKDRALDWLYTLFDRQYSFVWSKQYENLLLEGKTPIGICRTMEYLLVVRNKENKRSLGLVKFYYDEAQKYYEQYNELASKHMVQLTTANQGTKIIKRRKGK